ncbi:MAG: hypothetical protein CVU22_04990 [Betaproteobacteria bacterium HGW-Betaproteobacteria-16]|nr:MAG: hypothetical protein CVU22_04990 [Betaproteobacteria bacterium HGW-Betaproteobacteria-16]
MPDAYPYTIANKQIEPMLTRIRTAARPERMNRELLNTWGFTASNDRAIVSVLKGLGFVADGGSPTDLYDRLRDPSDWKYVLGERIRILYSDLYSIDPNIHAQPDTEVRSAILRLTGKDEETSRRYYLTFKTLAGLANFGSKAGDKRSEGAPPTTAAAPPQAAPPPALHAEEPKRRKSEYHYNIQIHLPVTSDISVYNAIFKSLKDNLDL